MRRNEPLVNIPDLMRRADAVLAAEADIDTAVEGRPIDHDALEAAMNGPVARNSRRRRGRRSLLQTISCARPRCPRCGGIALEKYRSIADQGDGSSLWWMRCAEESCGHRFKVAFE